jgi:hypothetical protein
MLGLSVALLGQRCPKFLLVDHEVFTHNKRVGQAGNFRQVVHRNRRGLRDNKRGARVINQNGICFIDDSQ